MPRQLQAVAVLLAAVALAPALRAQDVKVKEEKPGLLKQATVASSAAIATAQARLPGEKLVAAEIEQENGRLIYSFDFKAAGKPGSDEVNVDAKTGKLVGKVEHESPAAEKKEAAADSTKAARKKP